MGLVRMGPPEEVILRLQREFGLAMFVETGTYHGGTAVWAASHFAQVATIELSDTLYQATSERYRHFTNIRFLYGDSRQQLVPLLDEAQQAHLFLAGWALERGSTYGETDQCPLLDEIAIINRSSLPHFLFIDDARLFLSPPGDKLHAEQWPSIAMVLDAIRARHDYYIVVLEDVIIAVPPYAKEILVSYCEARNAELWRSYARTNAVSFRAGIGRIGAGVRVLAQAGRAGITACLRRWQRKDPA